MGPRSSGSILVAVLFVGFFLLEGFDFGVGMLDGTTGRMGAGPLASRNNAARRSRRVQGEAPAGGAGTRSARWDGNEVWLITAGGASSWHSRLARHGVLRAVPTAVRDPVRDDPVGRRIEWRARSTTRSGVPTDIGIAVVRGCPRSFWGTASAIPAAAFRWTPTSRCNRFTDVINPYTPPWVGHRWPVPVARCGFPAPEDRRRGADEHAGVGTDDRAAGSRTGRGIRAVDRRLHGKPDMRLGVAAGQPGYWVILLLAKGTCGRSSRPP